MTKTYSTDRPRASRREEATTPGSVGVFTNILCAVDGTRTSTTAVEMAASLAAAGGHLTLLAVTAVSGAGVHATAAISPGRADLVLGDAERHVQQAAPTSGSSTIVDAGRMLRADRRISLTRALEHDLLERSGHPSPHGWVAC